MLLKKKYPYGNFHVYADRPSIEIVEVIQKHTAKIFNFQGQEQRQEVADGIITRLSNLNGRALAIKTADCLPVLFLNSEWVAIIHAGWRGLKQGILQHQLLQDHQWEYIYIAPAIKKYEVGTDFLEHFPQSSNFKYIDSKLYFDLQKEAVSQLQLYSCSIEQSSICTLQNTDYNSYRRDKTTKRNWNIFRI